MLRVDIDAEARIATLTLDRPEKRNALSTELMERLTRTLRELGDRTDVGVIVLTASGRVFSAGHDIAEMVDRSLADYQRIFDTCTVLMETIQQIPQPVIAMVRGVATAAGCQLVAACDLAFAEDTASFGTTGIQIGLFCSTPSVAVGRNIGRKRAMQLLVTGERIDARTAAEWGLINEAVPAEALEARTREVACQILRWSPSVIGLGKQAFYSQIEMDQHRAYDHMKTVMSMNALERDAHEGMTAFLEKRAPVWSGR
ncbi:MAG: enoyl-CoA hydratase [Chloroflexi bacterium]|nr:enoyl-CoA hydratase [Chloroflexota bacterium]